MHSVPVTIIFYKIFKFAKSHHLLRSNNSKLGGVAWSSGKKNYCNVKLYYCFDCLCEKIFIITYESEGMSQGLNGRMLKQPGLIFLILHLSML